MLLFYQQSDMWLRNHHRDINFYLFSLLQ